MVLVDFSDDPQWRSWSVPEPWRGMKAGPARGKSLFPMLMLQLAIPSDLASYLFGLVRCRFIVFVAALALAEVPYALGSVYLGTSFLERRIVPLLALGIAGVLLSLWAIRRLHHHPEPQP